VIGTRGPPVPATLHILSLRATSRTPTCPPPRPDQAAAENLKRPCTVVCLLSLMPTISISSQHSRYRAQYARHNRSTARNRETHPSIWHQETAGHANDQAAGILRINRAISSLSIRTNLSSRPSKAQKRQPSRSEYRRPEVVGGTWGKKGGGQPRTSISTKAREAPRRIQPAHLVQDNTKPPRHHQPGAPEKNVLARVLRHRAVRCFHNQRKSLHPSAPAP